MRELDPDLRSLQEVRDAMRRAKQAVHDTLAFDQARTDAVCRAMVQAAVAAAGDLARLAVEETGMGRVHYKILKNLFGAEGTWESIEKERTVGVIHRDDAAGLVEIATPAGVVAGIVPTTNPTSTAIFKALIAVKGRNAMVISPHPRAKRCIGETVEVLRRAIERAGANPDLVQSLANPTIESTGALMRHRDTALILATGGEGLVNAAYSSGRPAYGVGPGNVPCYVDRTADLARAARFIVASQSFDNGTLCCSEQGIVLDRPIGERMIAELVARGAHVCDPKETELLARLANRNGMMNADVVGQDPWKIASLAGFRVPEQTSVLLAHQGGIGKEWPLSIEILCPILSVHVVDGWEEGCRACIEMLRFGGLGHTMAVHAGDQAVLDAFALQKPANRIVVNGPSSQGAVGYSTALTPSMSLGCGPQAGNISSDNITARHLINVKRAVVPRRDWDERERRDHARAASLGGDASPRGAGLPGDPAAGAGLHGARAAAPAPAPAASNWRGNPALPAPGASASRAGATSASSAAGSLRSKVGPGLKSAPPTFTGHGASSGGHGLLRPAPPRAAGARPQAGATTDAAGAAPRPAAPAQRARAGAGVVGSSLGSADIRAILEHAGTGCPLGPCRGCPHQEVTTGACTA